MPLSFGDGFLEDILAKAQGPLDDFLGELPSMISPGRSASAAFGAPSVLDSAPGNFYGIVPSLMEGPTSFDMGLGGRSILDSNPILDMLDLDSSINRARAGYAERQAAQQQAREEGKKAIPGALVAGSGFIGDDEVAKRLGPAAREVGTRLGIDPAVILAIAANEAGGDLRSNLARTQNNPFGIKDSRDPSGWARFDTYEEAVDYFGRLVSSGRYASAYNNARGDPNAFVDAIADAGYIQPDQREAWKSQIKSLVGKYKAAPAQAQGGRGETAQAGQHQWTIAFGFNERYSRPLPSGITQHRGVDLQITGAPNGGKGQTYGAFQPGVVKHITNDPAGGIGIIILGDDGLYHRYFHNDRVLVAEGQRIEKGQAMGVVGDTGTRGFPHLHYEVARNVNGDPQDQLIDPRPYMR